MGRKKKRKKKKSKRPTPSSKRRLIFSAMVIIIIVLVVFAGFFFFKEEDGGGNGDGKTPNPPRAKISVDLEEIFEGETITFDAKDSIGDIEDYQWEFGDGGEDSGRFVTHRYEEVGKYRVRLTVVDSRGDSHSDTHYIHVHYTQTTAGTLSFPLTKDYGIPVREYALSIKVTLTYPTGSIVQGIPGNDLDINLYYPNGTLYLSSDSQEPDEGDKQEEELNVPTQELAASFYQNWKVEVEAETGIEVDYDLVIVVTY